MLRVGELGGPFLHEGIFHLLLVHLLIDLVHDRAGGHDFNLAGVVLVKFFDGIIGGGRVCLDVGAGEGFDIFVGGVGGFFGAGAGEDEFLGEGRSLPCQKA